MSHGGCGKHRLRLGSGSGRAAFNVNVKPAAAERTAAERTSTETRGAALLHVSWKDLDPSLLFSVSGGLPHGRENVSIESVAFSSTHGVIPNSQAGMYCSSPMSTLT